jgi:pimeloyl-ACP methyl ester carboxylesterase
MTPLTQFPADALPQWFSWAIEQKAESRFVERAGNQLHYLAWNLHETAKPLLVFVHGFRAHSRWWDFIAPYFITTHRVVAMDLSGMGDSGWRQTYAASAFADDISGFIAALGLGPAVVAAHSYGGLCALRAAAAQPEHFRHLVVIDTFFIFDDMALPTDPVRITGHRVFPDFAAARTRYRLMPPQPTPLAYTVNHVFRHSLVETEGGLRWKFDGGLQQSGAHRHDNEVLLARITTPVDYIYGESSALISAHHARRVVDALPNARGPIAIPDGHHHLMLDQPIALISTLRALLT